MASRMPYLAVDDAEIRSRLVIVAVSRPVSAEARDGSNPMITIEPADWRDQYETAKRATVAYLRLTELVFRQHYDEHAGPIHFCTSPACQWVARSHAA